MSIRVLALDDERFGVCYATENAYYPTTREFMRQCLLPAHDTDYEVRMVSYFNPPGKLRELTERNFIWKFNMLSSINNPAILFQESEQKWNARQKVFEFFWENAEHRFYV